MGEEKQNVRVDRDSLRRSVSDAVSGFACKRYSLIFFTAFAFFCFFISALIGGYNVFDILGDKNEACTLMYLWDYSVGFTTRLFVGAVIGLFKPTITPTEIFTIAGWSVLVSFAVQAVLGGIVLRKSVMKKEYIITLFTLVFLLHSLTSLENIRIKGCLDTYILILFLLWLFCFDKYAGILTSPLLCVICMLIHYSYIFTFMPPVLAVMFYLIFFSEKRSKRIAAGISFGVGSTATVSLFVYFVFFANSHLKMTSDELYDHMVSRYDLTALEKIHMSRLFDGDLFFRLYMDGYLFNKDRQFNQLGGVKEELELIREEVVNYVGTSVYIKYSLVFIPFFVAVSLLWIACMKKVKGVKKLPFIVFIGMPVVLIPACIMSTDVWRWVSAAIISQLGVLFVLYVIRDKSLIEVINSEKLQKPSVKAVLVLLCMAYTVYALWFGVDLPIAR